ncbi:MAG: proton-conducting transporter membrane subunit [Deltaproteobacteria bacterium]
MIKVLTGAIGRPAAIIGLLLTLCGFFFKLAVFPFHFWAPDAYRGLPIKSPPTLPQPPKSRR